MKENIHEQNQSQEAVLEENHEQVEEFLLNIENNPDLEEIKEIPEEEIKESKGWFRNILRFIKRNKIKVAIAATTLSLTGEYFREKNMPYQYDENVKPATESVKEQFETMHANKSNVLPEVVIYGSRDPETDMILNYLSGKEDLSHQYKVHLSKIGFIGSLRDTIETPFINSMIEKIEAMDTLEYEKYIASDEIKEDLVDIDFSKRFADKNLDPKNYSLDEKCVMVQKDIGFVNLDSTQEFLDREYSFFDFEYNPNDIFKGVADTLDINVYDAVWEMHAKHGNPNITYSRKVGPTYTAHNLNKRAYYNGINDKMYLPFQREPTLGDQRKWGFTLHDWIAELSHAKQEEVRPVVSSVTFLIDMLRIAKLSHQNNISYDAAQLNLYKTPGSLEYEAHSEIQKKLEEEFKKRTNIEIGEKEEEN